VSDIEYSGDAVAVLGDFYDAEFVVFVEGDDDVDFWEIVFSKVADVKVSVQEKGGCGEIDRYAQRVIDEGLDVIICRDSDYLCFSGGKIFHKKIIYTPCHSIEASIFCPEIIARSLRRLCKGDPVNIDDIWGWVSDVVYDLSDMVAAEVVSQTFDLGEVALGSNVGRFTCHGDLSKVDAVTVQARALSIANKCEELDMNSFRALSAVFSNKENYIWVRGHFWEKLVLHYVLSVIEAMGRKVPLSMAALRSLALTFFELEFDQNHQQFDSYKTSVIAAIT